MDRWDLLILLAAGYWAIMSLVRLMAARRNQLIDQFREQLNEQRKIKSAAKQQPAEAEDRDVA